MNDFKEKLNDARSKFMVRFLCLNTVKLINHFPFYQQITMIRAFGALGAVIDSMEDLRKHVGFLRF